MGSMLLVGCSDGRLDGGRLIVGVVLGDGVGIRDGSAVGRRVGTSVG